MKIKVKREVLVAPNTYTQEVIECDISDEDTIKLINRYFELKANEAEEIYGDIRQIDNTSIVPC